MSRLNHTEYLIRHEMVHQAWERDKRFYSCLTVGQQRDIHAYFLAAHDCSDAALLEHRRQVTTSDPSLPHRASRAFLVMLRPPVDRATTRSTKPNRANRKISVRPVIRPDVDVDALAKVLLEVVQSMTTEERERLADARPEIDAGVHL
jgi:hypothetical protein